MNIAFILETALIILVVFLIGAILGYLIRCWFFKPQAAGSSTSAQIKPVAQSAPVASATVAPPPAPAPPSDPSPAPVAAAPAEPETPEVEPEEEAPNVTESEAEPESTPEPEPKSAPLPEITTSKADSGDKTEADGKPVGLLEPRNGQKDDLKRIKGIGPKIEGTLNELGIFHFDQIAEWTPASVDWINGFLSFKGRVQRENWIDQAKDLAGGSEN